MANPPFQHLVSDSRKDTHPAGDLCRHPLLEVPASSTRQLRFSTLFKHPANLELSQLGRQRLIRNQDEQGLTFGHEQIHWPCTTSLLAHFLRSAHDQLEITPRPRRAGPPLHLNDQAPGSVLATQAQRRTRRVGHRRLDVLIAGRLNNDLLRHCLPQQQIERQPHSHLYLVLVADESRVAMSSYISLSPTTHLISQPFNLVLTLHYLVLQAAAPGARCPPPAFVVSIVQGAPSTPVKDSIPIFGVAPACHSPSPT